MLKYFLYAKNNLTKGYDILKSDFFKGAYHGIPIALGYLSVSFGFGILAVKSGLSILSAGIISITNLTSAGQVAGVGIIATHGTILEMILTQLIINIRYALMALSLSQKLDNSFNTPKRLIASYGITDEIFAVASAQTKPITPSYMYGLIAVSFLGWTSGTIIGAVAGEFLPLAITNAMGIVLYGMFIAIIIPPARKERSVLFVVSVAGGLSVLFKYLLPALSSGFAIIISALIASALGALLFPIDNKEAEE